MNLTRPEKSASGPYKVRFSPAVLARMNGFPEPRRAELAAWISTSLTEDPYSAGEPSFERERRVLSVGNVTVTCMVDDIKHVVTVTELGEAQP